MAELSEASRLPPVAVQRKNSSQFYTESKELLKTSFRASLFYSLAEKRIPYSVPLKSCLYFNPKSLGMKVIILIDYRTLTPLLYHVFRKVKNGQER